MRRKLAHGFLAVTIVGSLAVLAPLAQARYAIQGEPSLKQLPPGAEQVEKSDLFLTEEPWAEVKPDGKAIVHWKTKVPTPAAKVYYGVYLPDQELDYPQYRKEAQEKLTEPALDHAIRINIKDFEKPKYDAAHFAERGEGVIAYRVEVFDPEKCATRIYDRCFHFKKVDDTYLKALTITEGPFVDQVTKKSAIISWETDEPSMGAVVVGDVLYADRKLSRRHEIRLAGLNPGKVYSYEVKSWSGESPEESVVSRQYQFKTEPEIGEAFKFAHTSDSREGMGGGEYSYKGLNYRTLADLFTIAYRQDVDFILFGGDLVNGYTTDRRDFELQLEAWKKAVEPIGHYVPIYEGVGNHEALMDVYATPDGEIEMDKKGSESAEAIFAQEFVNPAHSYPDPEDPKAPSYRENVYYFDYGNSRFISFNTNYWWCGYPEDFGGNLEGHVMDNQLRWIEGILADAKSDSSIKHVFMFAHEPAFPNGGHIKDAQWYSGGVAGKGLNYDFAGKPLDRSYVPERRDKLWRVISQCGKVRAVFFGDEHNYQRVLIDSQTPVHLDGSVDPDFIHPVWQIVNGCAGAPFYAQDRNVPWTGNVKAFSSQNAICIISVEGTKVSLTTYSRTGQIIDECELTAIKG